MKKVLKIVAFGGCYAILIYIVFLAEMIWQFLQLGTEISMESEFFSEFWYNVIYYGLPIIAFVIPFVFIIWKRPKRKEIIKCSAITLLSYLLIVCAISVSLNSYFKVFTTPKWAAYPYQRELMIDDLQTKHELVGMTVDEVKDLLGNPDVENDTELQYLVSDGLIDPRIMTLRLEGNTVKSVSVYEA